MRDEFAVRMDEKGRFFAAKEKKLISKNEKRYDKLAQELQSLCEKKVAEITTEYDQ